MHGYEPWRLDTGPNKDRTLRDAQGQKCSEQRQDQNLVLDFFTFKVEFDKAFSVVPFSLGSGPEAPAHHYIIHEAHH